MGGRIALEGVEVGLSGLFGGEFGAAVDEVPTRGGGDFVYEAAAGANAFACGGGVGDGGHVMRGPS